jgi:hypothetical protein
LNTTFTPTDSTNYTTATGSVSLTVNQATPVLHQLDLKIIYPHYDFKHLTEKYFEIGMKLNDFSIQLVKYCTQLNASASVPGTLVYSPTNGTVLSAGTQTLHVDFTPTDTVNYSTASKNVTLNVTKENPEITWGNPADIIYGAALNSTQLNATSFVPGTLVYTPVNGTVLGVGTQTLNVDFIPTDIVNYTTASKNVTLNVLNATPVITWSDPAGIIYGTALNSTQLNATCSTTSGTFAYNPASGTVLEAGTKTLNVTFTPTDNTNYTTANGSVSLTVNQATPVLHQLDREII